MTPSEQLASFLRFSYQDLRDADPDQVAHDLLSRVSVEDIEEVQNGLADLLYDLSVSIREWR